MSDTAALLTALGCASLPSVTLEIYRTLRARRHELVAEGEAQRRAPVVDTQFVLSAAREATDIQRALMDRLLARITDLEEDVKRLQSENESLYRRLHGETPA